MGERQPDMQRHDAGLRSGAEQDERQHQRAKPRRKLLGANRGEGISAVRAGKDAEGEKQRQRPGARHDDIDVAGAEIVGVAVVRHDQRPRGERHELPTEEEDEGVVGEQHEVHAGEEGRKERQDAFRRGFVPAVAEAVEARARPAEIDHRQEERRQRIDAEVCADPGDAERQGQRILGAGPADETDKRQEEQDQRRGEAERVDDRRGGRTASETDGDRSRRQEAADANEDEVNRHPGRLSEASTARRARLRS